MDDATGVQHEDTHETRLARRLGIPVPVPVPEVDDRERDVIACLTEAVTEQSRTIAAQADVIMQLGKGV